MNRTKEPQGSHHKRHAQWVKSVIVGDAPEHGLAGLVRAGPFLFTAGCDGDRELGSGESPLSSQEMWRGSARTLTGGLVPYCVAAAPSCPASCGWTISRAARTGCLARQAIRARLFGRPAPLASTGVAARMSDVNMLTAFAIAVADPADKEVLVEGPRFGMGNICSAVRGGPFIFVSGIRGAEDPRSGHAVEEETADSLFAQLRLCYAIIKSILTDTGTDTGAILRLDCYVRDITRSAENTLHVAKSWVTYIARAPSWGCLSAVAATSRLRRSRSPRGMRSACCPRQARGSHASSTQAGSYSWANAGATFLSIPVSQTRHGW